MAWQLEGFIERSGYEQPLRESVDPYAPLGGSDGR